MSKVEKSGIGGINGQDTPVVCGQWGEESENTHALLHAMAVNRVRVAGPSTGKRGSLRSEEGEMAMVMGYLGSTMGVATIKVQCLSLLGRLEGLGPGAAAAINWRKQTIELERRWRKQQQAYNLSERQGFAIHRSGFAKLK